MICKSCGAENSNCAKFCGKCGRNLQSGEKILIQIKKKEKKKSFGDDTAYNFVYLSIISRLICAYSKETNKRKSL